MRFSAVVTFKSTGTDRFGQTLAHVAREVCANKRSKIAQIGSRFRSVALRATGSRIHEIFLGRLRS